MTTMNVSHVTGNHFRFNDHEESLTTSDAARMKKFKGNPLDPGEMSNASKHMNQGDTMIGMTAVAVHEEEVVTTLELQPTRSC